ncbi:MAG: hypothetical protein ACI9H8_000055 [Lysobacterales bacterium]|jgi:hypothetical protein
MTKIPMIITTSTICLLMNACSWVKATPEAESVLVKTAEVTTDCERKGKVNVSLKDRIAGFDRKSTKVAKELATLARNEAAVMGGNTVVAESEVTDGRQEFGVYLCNSDQSN